MTKYYIVISVGPDGTYVHEVEKTELEKRLNEEYYGTDPTIYSTIPERMDYADGLIIIDGPVVTPKQVTTVTKWEMA